MRQFLILLNILCFAFVAYGADPLVKSSVVYKEALDNLSQPTDIVFQDKDNWLLYSVMGKITPYSKNKAGKPYQSKDLVGGICFVELDKNYYLCDSENKLLHKLNSKFEVISTVKSTTGKMRFDPTDIVKVNDGLYYIIDNDNHRILLWNPKDMKFTGEWGRSGTDRGSLRYPFSAVVDNHDLLYVTEVMNTRVQMFSPAGRSTFEVGGWGVNPGQFYRPKGIAMLNDKYLVVSDGYLGVLQVFDLYGNFVGVVSDDNGKVRRYSSPTRIRAYGDNVAVIDYYDHTLEILSITGLK